MLSLKGKLTIEGDMRDEHFKYLAMYGHMRHMKRNETYLLALRDQLRVDAGLPIGVEGRHYLGSNFALAVQCYHTVTDCNSPPEKVPSVLCPYHLYRELADGKYVWRCHNTSIEKPKEWIEYLITTYLAPWGYKLNGKIEIRDSNVLVEEINVVDNMVMTNVITVRIEFDDKKEETVKEEEKLSRYDLIDGLVTKYRMKLKKMSNERLKDHANGIVRTKLEIDSEGNFKSKVGVS